uniref:AGBL carboxypeptidase 4 n=1 Tax=Hucho hucho TaxID=62062 RepID=A0A4W5JEI6_9TELE
MKTTKQIVVVGLEPILTLWLRNLTVEASGNHPTPSHLSLSLHCVAVATLSQRCALVCCAKMERKMEENMRDVDTGSEAGGEDALVGNVNKLMVTPTGYTGVPRKGHLVFDACFESGNLGRVDYISEFEFDLFIRPDTCNPRFRVWFNFTVENVRETQRVIFNIVNFSKTKSLYRDGMSPVVKSTSRPKWQRLPTKNVYYYRCPDHRRNYVMSFAFCFDREDDVYQFAYCYPYTYTRLQHYLDSLERRNLDYLQREQLGLSVQQRRLDLLTITSPVHSVGQRGCRRCWRCEDTNKIKWGHGRGCGGLREGQWRRDPQWFTGPMQLSG